MKNKKISKKEAEEKITRFFNEINQKTPEEIRKIKRLAMSKNIKLRDLRKKFCKKCYSIFPQNAEIKIKKPFKILKCKNCHHITRWRIK